MKDYYKILQLKRDASSQDIKKSFRKLAKKFHPDANTENPNADQVFKELNEAYSILGDEEKKKEYDNRLFGTASETKKTSESKGDNNKKNNYTKQNMSNADFSSSSSIFEDFFGFNPKSANPDLKMNNEKVKPMKTNEAFEKIFGKRRF